MDLSPTGEAELCTGIQKLRYNGNWKFLPENSLEGDYHGPFLHRIAFELHSKRTGLDLSSLYQNEVPDVIRSLPGGHMVEDYRGASMAAPARKSTPARLAYVEMMEKRYGKQKAAALLGTTPPLVYVFPNLIYIMTHIRRVQPCLSTRLMSTTSRSCSRARRPRSTRHGFANTSSASAPAG